MGIVLYADMLSQPCRAVAVFLKANNIPFEVKHVDLVSRETRRAEYMAINPFHEVPVIDDDNFVLLQSEAILKYLTTKPNIEKHWYPSAPRQRAMVDEYISWHHMGLRGAALPLIREGVFKPVLAKTLPDPKAMATLTEQWEAALEKLEKCFLKEKKFLVGEEISIADLLCSEELNTVSFLIYDWQNSHPKLADYLTRVATKMNPVYDEYNKTVAGLGAKLRGIMGSDKQTEQEKHAKEEVKEEVREEVKEEIKEEIKPKEEPNDAYEVPHVEEEKSEPKPSTESHEKENDKTEPEKEPETAESIESPESGQQAAESTNTYENVQGQREDAEQANHVNNEEQEEEAQPAKDESAAAEVAKEEVDKDNEDRDKPNVENTYDNVANENSTEPSHTETTDTTDTTAQSNEMQDSCIAEPVYAEIDSKEAKTEKTETTENQTYNDVQNTTEGSSTYAEVADVIPKEDTQGKKEEEPVYSEVVKLGHKTAED